MIHLILSFPQRPPSLFSTAPSFSLFHSALLLSTTPLAMVVARESLANDRGQYMISPTIPLIGNVRKQIAYRERLNDSVPSSTRKFFQPLFQRMLDDKTRPAPYHE